MILMARETIVLYSTLSKCICSGKGAEFTLPFFIDYSEMLKYYMGGGTDLP